MAETIRAGIQAVPKGQVEAARSLGMSHGRTMLPIVIPQAFRIVIPPLTNELILLIKDSSLVYVLGRDARRSRADQVRPGLRSTAVPPLTPLLVGRPCCYLIITLPLSQPRRGASRSRYAKAR